MLTITSLFAALLAFWFVFLSVRVIKLRRENMAAVGDGGLHALQMAIRTHGNFAEYTPFVLVVMALCELAHVPSLLLAGLGVSYFLGRISHFYSLNVAERYEGNKLKSSVRFRVLGMVATFSTLGILAVCLLWRLIVAA